MSSDPALTTWQDILDATQLAVAPLADTIKVAAFKDTVTPNKSTDTAYNVAPWNAGEAASGTYSAGGQTLSSKSLNIIASRLVFGATFPTISSLTETGLRYLLMWDDTVAGDRILTWHDLGASIDFAGEPLVVTAPDGWWRLA